MLAGEPMLMLPPTVILSEILKGVVPIRVRDFLAGEVFGIYHTMDDFKGRAEQQR